MKQKQNKHKHTQLKKIINKKNPRTNDKHKNK